jgi:hypothetical protein
MASIDIGSERQAAKRLAPKYDGIGIGLLLFHLAVGAYILSGWIASSSAVLGFYLLLLPAVAAQWYFNRGSCVLNNFETWLRTGSWRDPVTGEDGRFLLMLSSWWLGIEPSRVFLDRLAYAVVFVLWMAGFMHLALLVNA